MQGRPRRVAILAQGCFTPLDAKTATGVLRYRAEEVAAVIDSERAGRSAGACVGAGGEIPVVAGLEAAAARGADSLLIGIAPQGGTLPDAWRRFVTGALERGWDVISGLHAFLADDAELAGIARRHGARLIDVRRPPRERRVGSGRAGGLDALVVLTVGSDCNVGKMTTALEIVRELGRRSVPARFVATGQTGIMVADQGAAVDAIPADFVAGAVEALVLEAARPGAGPPPEVVVVEGQGALQHPGYSGVTLALIHGASPRALVLCHQCGRARVRISGGGEDGPAISPLPELVRAYQTAAGWTRPARVVAVSLNTMGLDPAAARAACATAARETGLEAADPLRFGPGPLADALERELAARRRGTRIG